jgi:serine/threonine-protein kinase
MTGFRQRAAIFITVGIAGLAPAATATAAVASSAPGTARAATGCVRVAATIPVGPAPFGVAVNPKTNTGYVANFNGTPVSVLASCAK